MLLRNSIAQSKTHLIGFLFMKIYFKTGFQTVLLSQNTFGYSDFKINKHLVEIRSLKKTLIILSREFHLKSNIVRNFFGTLIRSGSYRLFALTKQIHYHHYASESICNCYIHLLLVKVETLLCSFKKKILINCYILKS